MGRGIIYLPGSWLDEALEYEDVDRAIVLKIKLQDAQKEWAAYTRKIRNKAKRAYAEAYGAFRFSYEETPNPERPEGLSYLAAQAVRMEAEDCWRRHVLNRD